MTSPVRFSNYGAVFACAWLAVVTIAPTSSAQDMIGPSGNRESSVPVMPPEAAELAPPVQAQASEPETFRYQREWDTLHRAGQYREAAELARTWHNDAVIQIGELSTPAAVALNALGTSYWAMGDPVRAARAFKDSIETAERTSGVFDSSLVAPLANLGELYLAQEDFEASVESLMRAKDITHRNQGIFNQEQGDIVESLTESYLGLGEVRQATREQSFLYGMARAAHGEDSPELVPALHKWAQWNIRIRRYAEARRIFREAIRVLETAYGPDDLRLVSSLNLIARSLSATGDNADSTDASWRPRDGWRLGKQALKRSIEIYREQEFVDQVDLLRQQSLLADLHMISGSRAKGMEIYKQAITEAREAGLSDEIIDAKYGLPKPLRVPTWELGLNRMQLEALGAGPHRVVFKFDLDSSGQARNLRTVLNTPRNFNVLKVLRQRLIGNAFRPRFVDGVPVPTFGMRMEYVIYPNRNIAVPVSPSFDEEPEPEPELDIASEAP